MLRCIALLALVAATSARAQEIETSSTASISSSITTRPEDARGLEMKPSPTFLDRVLFVPRMILFVPELVLRIAFFPIEGALWLINEYALDERLIDLLYNDERTAAILPLVLYLPGLGPRAGITAFHNDLFGHGEHISASAKYGGRYTQSYNLSFEADRTAGTHLWLELQGRYEREARLIYAGIGLPGGDTRFSQDRLLARLRAGMTVGDFSERLKLGGSVIFNRRRFAEAKNNSGNDPSIEQIYDTAQIPGFREGVDLFELTAELVIDLRDRSGFTSRGFYLEAFGGGAPPQDGSRFFHYGAEAITFIDLYKGTRVLSFRAAIEAVEADPGKVPFSELPRLGGPQRLRGYPVDLFRDKKALLGSIEYHYPIHHNVMGELFLDLGTVAPNYPELFRGGSKDWKLGYGGGLLIGSAESVWFRLDISYGDGLMVFLSTDSPHAFSGRAEEL